MPNVLRPSAMPPGPGEVDHTVSEAERLRVVEANRAEVNGAILERGMEQNTSFDVAVAGGADTYNLVNRFGGTAVTNPDADPEKVEEHMRALVGALTHTDDENPVFLREVDLAEARLGATSISANIRSFEILEKIEEDGIRGVFVLPTSDDENDIDKALVVRVGEGNAVSVKSKSLAQDNGALRVLFNEDDPDSRIQIVPMGEDGADHIFISPTNMQDRSGSEPETHPQLQTRLENKQNGDDKSVQQEVSAAVRKKNGTLKAAKILRDATDTEVVAGESTKKHTSFASRVRKARQWAKTGTDKATLMPIIAGQNALRDAKEGRNGKVAAVAAGAAGVALAGGALYAATRGGDVGGVEDVAHSVPTTGSGGEGKARLLDVAEHLNGVDTTGGDSIEDLGRTRQTNGILDPVVDMADTSEDLSGDSPWDNEDRGLSQSTGGSNDGGPWDSEGRGLNQDSGGTSSEDLGRTNRTNGILDPVDDITSSGDGTSGDGTEDLGRTRQTNGILDPVTDSGDSTEDLGRTRNTNGILDPMSDASGSGESLSGDEAEYQLSGETTELKLKEGRNSWLENGLIQDRTGVDDETAHRIMLAIASEGNDNMPKGLFADWFMESEQFSLSGESDAFLRGDFDIARDAVPLEDGTFHLEVPTEMLGYIDYLSENPETLQDVLDGKLSAADIAEIAKLEVADVADAAVDATSGAPADAVAEPQIDAVAEVDAITEAREAARAAVEQARAEAEALANAEIAQTIRENLEAATDGALDLQLENNDYFPSSALADVGVRPGDEMGIVSRAIELGQEAGVNFELRTNSLGSQWVAIAGENGTPDIVNNNEVKARMEEYMRRALYEYITSLEETAEDSSSSISSSGTTPAVVS